MDMQPLAPRTGLVLPSARTTIPKVFKSKRACEKCRSLRKRCDSGKPCGGCRRLQVVCEYSGLDGRKKQDWKARIQALEQRNQYLEQQLEQLKCNQAAGQETPPQEPTLPASSSESDGNRRSTSSSTLSSSTSTIGNRGRNALQSPPVDQQLEQMFYAATAAHPFLGSLQTQSGRHRRNMRDQLPEEHFTRFAVDAFFQCAATLFYVTTEDQATQLINKVYHTEDATTQDICELAALAAIGSHYTINKVPDAARASYFFLATTNLNEAVQAYHIQGLRVFICLCMSCIMDKSLSARLLTLSGLNLARARTEAKIERADLNEGDMDEYKRTLQTLIFLEGWLSYSLGYRSCLRENEIDLVRFNIPSKGDFLEVKAFTTCLLQYQMARLALITSELQDDLVLCQKDYWTYADPLSQKLDLWYEGLSPELHLAALGTLEEEREVTKLQERGIYMMHMLYIDSRLQLYCQLFKASQAGASDLDPSFLEKLFRQVPGHVRDMHTGFAIQLARVLSLMFSDEAIMTRCWLVIRSAFDSCVVLLLGLCHKYFTNSGTDTRDLAEILTHVNSCFQVLCFCGSRDHAADRLREIIDPILKQLSLMSLDPVSQIPDDSAPGSALQRHQEQGTNANAMTIQFILDGKASETLTLVGMTHQLLKFMPPQKWDIWV